MMNRARPRRWRLGFKGSAGLLAAALLCGGVWLQRSDGPASSAAIGRSPGRNGATLIDQARLVNAELRRSESIDDSLPQLPQSLVGTGHGVVLQTQADRLLISAGIMDLFEFYLSAYGEEDLELILRRIRADLQDQLGGAALLQAQNLLHRYIDYKIDLAELQAAASTPPSLAAIAEQQARLQELRRERFSSEEVAAFFASEELEDQYMLERLRIQSNAALSPAEKSRQAALLEAQLPAEVREVRERASRDARIYEDARALQAAGASEQAIFELREAALGAEAAQSLAKLDQQHRQWEQRLQDFAQEYAMIRQSGLSEQDQRSTIDRLIDEKFDGGERSRARAFAAQL